MKIAVFSSKSYDKDFLNSENHTFNHQLTFFETRLTTQTAALAKDFEAVCVFVNDDINKDVINILAQGKTKVLALRSAGYNHVNIDAATANNISVLRVPAYSPYAVAEHAVALILSLNRQTHKAYARVRESNFSLDGLLGFDLHDKTVAIIGTGQIGSVFAKIMHGFGCKVIAYDPYPNPELENIVSYLPLGSLFEQADVISLHCPLTPETKHIIDDKALEKVKAGVMVINTSRGALIDTKAAIKALKDERIGYLGLDVYEEESDLFFENLSTSIIQDDTFMRLLTFPNVLITGHQGFFTKEAVTNIMHTTLKNLSWFEQGNFEELKANTVGKALHTP